MDILIITIAYVMDLVFGDPRCIPHPVKIIGNVIEKLEKILRKMKNEKFSGGLLALIIISGTYFITAGIIKSVFEINKFSGYLLSAIFIYTSLSIKDLAKESILVYVDLKNNDIIKARKDLSMIVGRDTENLEKEDIIRASVETIAEGFLDGVVSPLFYTFLGTHFFGIIGGVSFVLTYKAINTLDSMVGYKNEKYIKFGYVSAKIDDIVNFIPARISGVFLAIGSTICSKDGKKALKLAFKDGIKNLKHNSEIPEVSLAGALNLRLGGINYYNAVRVNKQFLGDSSCRNAGVLDDITCAIKIMYVSSSVTLISGIIVYLFLK